MKGQPWRPYESKRKRQMRLDFRLTNEEREMFYMLAKNKDMSNIDLLLYLVEKELNNK